MVKAATDATSKAPQLPCSIFLSSSLVHTQAASAAVQVVCNVSIISSIQAGPIAGKLATFWTHLTVVCSTVGGWGCSLKAFALRPRLSKSPVGWNLKAKCEDLQFWSRRTLAADKEKTGTSVAEIRG